MKPQKPRDNIYDVAKGLCIILVVFGHAERGLNGPGAPPHFSLMGFCDYAIYTFHMPFFSSCRDYSSPDRLPPQGAFLASLEKISSTPISSGQFSMEV
ncbi:hypothetical protein JUM41_17915 [Rhizobium pusense]|uniref:hypothetical protein n=1 Tax=Agrobacterium pusense TaxID=648995 RepID=UPI001FCD4E8E|nr:hypothetical protein [Agrobacterium pusense]MCJ2876122.1 hypothetical protein [Agrobacterium pusense]